MEDYKLKIQEATGFCRAAERNMFGGKNSEAVELLNKADEIALMVANISPDDVQVKSLLKKIEKMRGDLERKGIATRTGGKQELPFEVNAQLLRIKECVLNRNLERAQSEMNNYFARFAGPFSDIPEIRELQSLIDKMKAEEAARQQKETEKAGLNVQEMALHEQLCNEWRGKLKAVPYFDGNPQNITDLTAHVKAFSQAGEMVKSFSEVSFTREPDYTLQSMVADMERRIGMFIPNFNRTIGILADEINQRINGLVMQLTDDVAWQSAPSVLPLFIGDGQLRELNGSISELLPLCTGVNRDLEGLKANYRRLETLNNERKKIRASAVRMEPEVMSGAEADPLHKAAVTELEKANPDIVIMKVGVTGGWKERTEEGWEDTSRTKWVTRNFRDATVQIAARNTDGQYKLYTMNVDETRNPEGVYGNIRSHVMYTDDMVQENI